MGDTISSLVFRPPKPTPIHPSEYFYLDVDVYSPLCTNKKHRGQDSDNNCIGDEHGNCGGAMCLDTGQSDLASLDANFGVNGRHNNFSNGSTNIDVVASVGSGDHFNGPLPPGNNGNGKDAAPVVNNVRNGQVYKIPAFFIRRRNATQTLLFSHGNAEDLGMMYNRMKDLALVLGVNIMAYDYTGYGLSVPGPAHGNGGGNGVPEGPSENMIYRNIEAAYRYLTQVRKIPPHQIILYGRSLGSGPSCYLAAKTALNGASVGGLVLHSPFLSVYKVVADLNGLDLGMVGDLFHNEKRAKNVRCPTLIIHGRQDEVVPFWHAPRLLAAIPPEFRAQPYYVDDMGHNHIESRRRDSYVRVVLNFLRNNAAAQQQQQQREQQRTREGERGGVEHDDNGATTSNSATYRGPSPVPVNERASPSETKENASFYVNKTWLRHAKVLLKEVFADAGCYVNTCSYHCDDGNASQRCSTAVSSSASSARSRGRSVGSQGRNGWGGGGGGGLSDARDDEEDEFAPWRGAGGGNRSRSAGAAANHASGNENQGHGCPDISDDCNRQATHPQHRARPEKILTARRDNNGANHSRRPGSIGIGNNSPRWGGGKHGKSKSMTLDVSSGSSIKSKQRQKDGRAHSKSMQLLEGLNRQRRY